MPRRPATPTSPRCSRSTRQGRVTGADELLVTTITTEHVNRVRSTESLAAAWAEHAGEQVGFTSKESNKPEASVAR
jgi:hypothetical protein